MKVKYKHSLKNYSGKNDGLVYYYHKRSKCYLARLYVKPRLQAQNIRLGAITKHLWALEPSPGFLYDLDIHRQLCNGELDEEQAQRLSAQTAYIKLMWAMAKLLELDLLTLSREDIVDQNLPCRSVKRAVEAGLLPAVSGYERLTAEF